MNSADSPVILSRSYRIQKTKNRLRLIRTMDIFQNADTFSLFLSTESPDGFQEDFVYDISRSKEKATLIFEQLCRGKVTALSLREITEDILVCE